MSFIELATNRCSIRSFKPDPVGEEALNDILEAGRLAPTAKNLQPFQFLVVRDEAVLAGLADAYPGPFLREAPVVIVVCVAPELGWVRGRYDNKNYAEVDAAIAADHMTLAAADQGLGTCWIGAFNPEKVTDVLGLPTGIDPLVMLPIGIPNGEGLPKKRKPLAELVRYDQW